MDQTVNIFLDRIERLSAELGRERAAREAAEETVMRSLSAKSVIELCSYMAAGQKIEAIKLYRQIVGYGLKESKDAVEAVMDRPAPERAY